MHPLAFISHGLYHPMSSFTAFHRVCTTDIMVTLQLNYLARALFLYTVQLYYMYVHRAGFFCDFQISIMFKLLILAIVPFVLCAPSEKRFIESLGLPLGNICKKS